jgi:hypothetical protein
LKYTFLSKWTVLILTIVTILLAGYALYGANLGLPHDGLLSVILLIVAILVYAFAWIIAFADSIQEHRWLWTVVLIILLPIWIGPLLYSLIGPRNTK